MKEKGIFTIILAALSAWIGILAIPVIILVVLNLIDYGTGLAASKYRNEQINSYKSFRGIFKKVCMWLLIVLGGIVDWLIWFAADSAGLHIGIVFLVSCIVAVWLICNEIISILENIKDIGVELPPFLLPIVSRIKSKTEEEAKKVQEGDTDE